MKNIKVKNLETERLILKKISLDDAEALYKNWGSDPKASETLTWEKHESVEVTKNLLTQWIKEYEEDYSYNWIVVIKATNEPIGNIEVVKCEPSQKTCEIGYCYGSKYWGQGYASEALRRVIEFMLLEIEVNLVEARHISENPASGRVMEKAGMKKEAILRSRRINKATGNTNDLIVYSIMKDEL